MNAVDELIRLYAKQLKIPSFAEYQEVLRQADPSAGFSDLLLELMKAETASRQENQNRRRLKAAGFPYLKTMEEFDYSQLNDAVSPLFLQELASCQFIQNRQNVIMIGNPGRGKTHLAIALGLKACTQGYNVLFKNTPLASCPNKTAMPFRSALQWKKSRNTLLLQQTIADPICCDITLNSWHNRVQFQSKSGEY